MQHSATRREKQSDAAIQQRKARDAPKIRHYCDLCGQLYKLNKEKEYSVEYLKLSAAIIQLNPEMPTAWSYRRRILSRVSKDASQETTQELYIKDLQLTLAALRQNPKNYSTWEHRKWLLKNMPDPPWKAELALVGKFLEADARNFHGWNYRRQTIDFAPIGLTSLDKEFNFTTSKISSSFSNYSAWHYRSKLLGKRTAGYSSEDLIKVLDEEFELVRQALYTDPTDQSSWFYHRLLLNLYPFSNKEALIKRELASIEELAELDEGELSSRWSLDALVHFHSLLASIQTGQEALKHKEEAMALCNKLAVLDKDRQGRYGYLERSLGSP